LGIEKTMNEPKYDPLVWEEAPMRPYYYGDAQNLDTLLLPTFSPVIEQRRKQRERKHRVERVLMWLGVALTLCSASMILCVIFGDAFTPLWWILFLLCLGLIIVIVGTLAFVGN
jgi:O-antigen/teichoic acid export membrane protein